MFDYLYLVCAILQISSLIFFSKSTYFLDDSFLVELEYFEDWNLLIDSGGVVFLVDSGFNVILEDIILYKFISYASLILTICFGVTISGLLFFAGEFI